MELDEKVFIFLDHTIRAFKCRMRRKKPWLYRWDHDQKGWIPVREISQEDIEGYYAKFNANVIEALREIIEQEKTQEK